MNLAKLSGNGQITVPIEIRRKLKLREGDKILFIQRESGEIVIDNASSSALFKVQEAVRGLAEQLDLRHEDDVQALVDEVRYKKGGDDK